MRTEISSPIVRPVTVDGPRREHGARSPTRCPAGSVVDAVTTTVPSVASVAVTPYRSVTAGWNAGYMATPAPATASVCTGADAARVGGTDVATVDMTTADRAIKSPRCMTGG